MIGGIIGTMGTSRMFSIVILRTFCAGTIVLGVVLLMPWRGRFMCHFVVAGIWLRYFKINFLEIFGHPLRYPLGTAFCNVENGGLHSTWLENFTLLAHVRMECVNNARSTPLCIELLGCRHDQKSGSIVVGRHASHQEWLAMSINQ